ncbi:MAG: cupredoxin domain-containing protein, partial [Pseudomonadota bacterium]|nr:cupredoxin domain-containing protein [Pseudomonadota bacterium]
MNPRRSLLLALLLSTFAAGAIAADVELQLVIKNHRFEPGELKVPAGQRIKLVIDNRDDTPEEFDSHDLNREKLVPPGS